MQDKIFYSVCAGFIFGVFLRSFVHIDIFTALFIGGIGLALVIFFILISKNKWGIIFSIFILTFSLGIMRFHISDQSAPYIFELQTGQSGTFTGVIIDEPSTGPYSYKLVVQTELDSYKTKILITANLVGEYKYGDRVSFTGRLEKPVNFITDQGKEFDYINYLKKDAIFYTMIYPSIEVLSSGHGNFVKNSLFSVKRKFLEKINFSIKEPESLLMGGLILGERSAFDEELRLALVYTGTIHIVALSGYNVTIVAEWIIKIFSFLPHHFAFGLGIIGILLFVLMAGGSSTAVRAGSMAILALIARATGRTYDVARGLILAGVFMILINPLILVYDVSFQLSFIATVAVIFFAPRIEKYFLWVPENFKLRDIISVTCAAYIFVLPYIVYKMGSLSLIAFFANVLILPFIPFTMLLGFLTGLFGFINSTSSIILGYVSSLFLSYELAVINFFHHVPYGNFSIYNFPLALTILIYTYFIYRLFGRNIKSFFIERS